MRHSDARIPLLALALAVFPAPGARGDDSGEERTRVVRSHDIRFLTEPISQFPAGRLPRPGSAGPRTQYGEEDPGEGVRFGHDREQAMACEAGLPPRVIVDLIRHGIARDTWSSAENRIEASDGRLLVTQTPGVQRQIEELLADLASRLGRMFTVDVALVPGEALGELDTRSSPWLPDTAFRHALARAGARGHRVSLTARDHQTVSTFQGQYRTSLVDGSINQTGVLPVWDTGLVTLPLGLTVEVHPGSIGATPWISLDLMIYLLRLDGEVERRKMVLGEIEMVPLALEDLRTTLLVERGRVALAGVFEEERESAAPRRFAVLVRVRPLANRGDRVPPAPGPDSYRTVVHDIRFLLWPGANLTAPLDPGRLLETLLATVDPTAWRDDRASLEIDSGLLLVTARLSTHAAIRAWLRERLRAIARLATVEVREFEGPLEAVLAVQKLAREHGALPSNWRDGGVLAELRPVFRAFVPGIVGSHIRANGYRARPYVADLECVSGGTGAFIQRTADPVVMYGTNGFGLDTTVRASGGGAAVMLDLGLRRYTTKFGREARFLVPARLVPSGPAAGPREEKEVGTAHDGPGRATAWIPRTIDLVNWQERHALARSSPPPGREVVVRVRETREGRARLVVSRVSIETPAESLPESATDDAGPVPERFMQRYEVQQLVRDTVVPSRGIPREPRIRGVPLGSYLWEDPPEVLFIGSNDPALEDVVGVVRACVAPSSWASARNSIEASGTAIAVTQRGEVHAQIEELLGEISRQTGRALHIELAIVPPDALGRVAPAWSRPGGAPWLEGDVLDRAVIASNSRARYLSGSTRPGERVRLTPPGVSIHLGDYHVSCTGVVPEIQPGPVALETGAFASIRVLLDPSGTWCRAEVTLGQVIAPPADHLVERRRLPRGDLDLLRAAQLRTGMNAAGPLHRTLVLGALVPGQGVASGDEPGLRPEAFVGLLRVTPLLAAEEDPDPTGLTVVDTRFLIEPPRATPSFLGDDEADEIRFPWIENAGGALLERAVLEAELRTLLGEQALLFDSPAMGIVIFRAPGEATARALSRLGEAVRESAPVVTIDLWQGAVDEEGLEDLDRDSALLSGRWLQRFSDPAGIRVRLAGLSGEVLSVDSVASRNVLRDIERVTGGTGAVLYEVGDPVVESVGEGLVLRARASVLPGRRRAQLRVQGELSREPGLQRQARLRETHEVRLAGDRADRLEPAGAEVVIDLPSENTERWEHTVTAAPGEPVLLNVLPDRDEPGHNVALIGVVHVFGMEPPEDGDD